MLLQLCKLVGLGIICSPLQVSDIPLLADVDHTQTQLCNELHTTISHFDYLIYDITETFGRCIIVTFQISLLKSFIRMYFTGWLYDVCLYDKYIHLTTIIATTRWLDFYLKSLLISYSVENCKFQYSISFTVFVTVWLYDLFAESMLAADTVVEEGMIMGRYITFVYPCTYLFMLPFANDL